MSYADNRSPCYDSTIRIHELIDISPDCVYSLNVVSWDEDKRQINLGKHEIDLALCETIFDFPMVTTEDDREDYGELRLQSLGWFNSRVVVLIWTDRPAAPHAISCRYGEKHEAIRYFEEAY